MPPWMKFILCSHLLMEKAGDPPAGGGGNPPPDLATLAKQNEDLRSMNQKLLDRMDAWDKKHPDKTTPAPDDKDLAAKAELERKANEDKASQTKTLTSAIKFVSGAKDWLKDHGPLLPKSIEGIFTQAEKETYADDIQKANEIKSALIQEFFAVEANLDLLTDAQKVTIEEFRKLAKNVKQERAAQLYEQIFEPTLASFKKIKKAELVSRGLADQSTGEQAYRDRRIKEARKQHLGEK